jgi:hypothetical protein
LSDAPNLPFGHNTLKLRAVFIPDGAQVSMSGITRVVGFDPVFIRAVRVPPGGAPPGYPFEVIGQATFTPDSDDQGRSTGTGSALAGMQDDPVAPGHRTPRQPPGSGLPMAGPASPWTTGNGVADNGQASDVRRPRRGVRSTQANFGAAVPTPHLDTSHDAIDAAVRALRLKPSDPAVPIFADRITMAGSPSLSSPAASQPDSTQPVSSSAARQTFEGDATSYNLVGTRPQVERPSIPQR